MIILYTKMQLKIAAAQVVTLHGLEPQVWGSYYIISLHSSSSYCSMQF